MTSSSNNQVQVKLFASLRQFVGGQSSVNVDIKSGDTIATIIDRLEIPQEKVQVVFLNARSTPLTTSLAGGEELSIFPAIGGG